MDNHLRKMWNKQLKLNWKFGFILLCLICIPQFILVIAQDQYNSNYGLVGLIMIISALLPFIFLNREGIEEIGIKIPTKTRSMIFALIAGIIYSLLVYQIGQKLYGYTSKNWFQYISQSFHIPDDITSIQKRLLFIITALSGSLFSPVGEELFFRGIIHRSFSNSLGERSASMIDSAAYALTQLSLFGLVFIDGQWKFYLIPALIWLFAMYWAGRLFYRMKKLTQSIWGAVICHAGFNIGMIYTIFYQF